MMGSRPNNSGMIPNFFKSSGEISSITSLYLISFAVFSASPSENPILALLEIFFRFLIILSIPGNAPPTINKILDVSTWIVSAFGCFRTPFSGTSTTVPSIIFKRACCTPSPLTSRVIDMFSPLQAILSISSI